MKHNGLEKRIESLEASTNPTIATLADFVLWQARGGGGNPKIEPELKAMLDKFGANSKHRKRAPKA